MPQRGILLKSRQMTALVTCAFLTCEPRVDQDFSFHLGEGEAVQCREER
jgi:hypothetical protein